MDRNDFDLIADLLDGITATRTWSGIKLNNPKIQQADARLHDVMWTVEKVLPSSLYEKLERAQSDVKLAYINAAVMYGIVVASTLLEASASPGEVAKYIIDFAEGKKGNDE